MWDLPGQGLEPVPPALAGGFLTTAPPGKPGEDAFDLGNFLCLSVNKTIETLPKGHSCCNTQGHRCVNFVNFPRIDCLCYNLKLFPNINSLIRYWAFKPRSAGVTANTHSHPKRWVCASFRVPCGKQQKPTLANSIKKESVRLKEPQEQLNTQASGRTWSKAIWGIQEQKLMNRLSREPPIASGPWFKSYKWWWWWSVRWSWLESVFP